MIKLCESIINIFSILLFEEKKVEKKEEHKVEYTLSSVFPTDKIMHEVKKYI